MVWKEVRSEDRRGNEIMKKKILAVLMVGVMAAMTLMTGCSASSSAGAEQVTSRTKYVWKMALNSTAGDNAYDMAKLFADRIYKQTNGKIVVQLYGGASLGSTTEILDGMKVGVADIMCESVGTLAPYTPLANIDAMPYAYSGYNHFMKVWNSKLGDEMRETIGKAAGFKLIGGCYRGPRIVTATKKMTTVKDFKGFKLRAPALDMYIRTWKWLKAAPTPLAMTETYTALQQGTVDGQENPMPDSMNYAFDEVCDYWIKTNHVYSCNLLIMDRTYYRNLPQDVKDAVQEAAAYASRQNSRDELKKEARAEKKLKKEGKHVIEVDTAAFADYFRDFAKTNYPELNNWVKQIKAMDPGTDR